MTITVSPQQYASRWSQGLQGATQKITDGVNAVTVAPSTKAVAAQAKMVANFTASVNSGKWARNTQKVTLADWKQAMTDKGISRIGTGAQAAESKMATFAAQLLPYEQTGQNQIAAMPSATLADSKARAVAWIDYMSKFQMK